MSEKYEYVCIHCCRFVCDFLRKNHSNNVEARLRYLGDLVKLDDSCGEVLEFLQLSIDRGMRMNYLPTGNLGLAIELLCAYSHSVEL